MEADEVQGEDRGGAGHHQAERGGEGEGGRRRSRGRNRPKTWPPPLPGGDSPSQGGEILPRHKSVFHVKRERRRDGERRGVDGAMHHRHFTPEEEDLQP